MATKNSPPPVNIKKNTPVETNPQTESIETNPQTESIETNITKIMEKTLQSTTQQPFNAPPLVGVGEESIVNKFQGLPMRELISAPLIAVCEAQQQLAATAFNFYKQVAFEEDGKTTRLIEFNLTRPVQTPGKLEQTNIKVSAPFIGLVPIPSLLIEAVNIDFQMEVTDATTSKTSTNAESSVAAKGKWLFCSVDVQGKVGTSRENTRTTNQTAKYQVHVTAGQQKPTEGLSKLMDIMASCIEPIETQPTPTPTPTPPTPP